MKVKTCLIVMCLAFFFVSSAYCLATEKATEKVNLKLNLQEGFSAVIREVKVKDSSLVTEDSVLSKTRQKTVWDYEIKCNAVDPNGVMEVWQTVKRIVIHEDGTEGKFEYDSNESGADIPPQAAPLAALVGNTIVMHVTPDGKVVKVKGIEKVVDDTLALRPPVTPEKASNIKKQFLEVFGDPANNWVAATLKRYPVEIVDEGYVWKDIRERKETPKQDGDRGTYTAKYTTKYTIKSIKKDIGVAKIEQKGIGQFNKDSQDDRLTKGPVSTENAEIYIDLTTGLIIFGEYSFKLCGEITGAKVSSTTTTIVRSIPNNETKQCLD